MYDLRPVPRARRDALVQGGALAYLRRVYALFTGGVALAVAGALVALYVGTPVAVAAPDGGQLAMPPIVAFASEHYILMMVGYFGAFALASFLRRTPAVNVVALFGYTFVTGLFLAPAIFIAGLLASHGATLDASPVRDAFLLAGAAFTGLTAFVFGSKRDFSYMGASLSMGLWVVLGASLLTLFVHSSVLSLAVASVGVLLFAGYILYDTSRILREPDADPVSAALRLFLDVVNLFIFLLRILSSERSR